MAMLALAQDDRRAVLRHKVERPAECRLGGSSLVGTVQDESEVGAFFAVERHEVPQNDDALAYHPELGDLVLLHYREEGDHKLKLATVKWRGHSHEHGCDGLGLCFDEF